MKNGLLQITTIVIGFVSFGLAVNTMLQLPFVIFPAWCSVLILAPLLIGISLTLGYFVKNLRPTKWKTISLTFLFIAILSLLYVFSEYRKHVKINIPDNYVGTVFLILSNEPIDDFNVNEFGVGYICQDTYSNGFRPTVYRKGIDITKTISGHSIGSASYLRHSSIKYIKFKVPFRSSNTVSPKVYMQDTDLYKTKKYYNNESINRNLAPDLEIKITSSFNGKEIHIRDLLSKKAIDKKRINGINKSNPKLE